MQQKNAYKQCLEGQVSLLQPPSFKYLTLSIFIIVVLALLFLSLGSYARKEHISGVLQPASGIVKLKATQSGRVHELLVKEGDKVLKGQPLLSVISDKQGLSGFDLNQSKVEQSLKKMQSTNESIASAKARYQLEFTTLKSDIANLTKQTAQLNIQQNIYQSRIKLNKTLLKKLNKLSDTGYISALEIKRQQDLLLVLQQQTSKNALDLLVKNGEINRLNAQLALISIEHNKQLKRLEEQLANLKLQTSIIKQEHITELRAPASGVVSTLLITKNSPVMNKQSLLSLLPNESEIQATMYISPEAFGFIEIGQQLRLRYQAFPYEKFGIYQGRITEVSANVILPNEMVSLGLISQPSYRISVALEAQTVSAFGKQIPLKAGMKVDADVIIDNRSLLHWLFEPFFSIKTLH